MQMTHKTLQELMPQDAVVMYENGINEGRFAEDYMFIGGVLKSSRFSLEERAILFMNSARRLIADRIDQKKLDHEVVYSAAESLIYPALGMIASNEKALVSYGSLMQHSPYTAVHSFDTGIIASCLVSYCELPHSEQVETVVAGILHDIGKVAIHQDILDKTGQLTQKEFNDIMGHTWEGYGATKVIMPDNPLVYESIRDHHERYNGQGYPRGLIAEDISCSARVLGIADSFDAATSDRPYREGIPVEIIVKELYENEGMKYDPRISNAFPMIFSRRVQDQIDYNK